MLKIFIKLNLVILVMAPLQSQAQSVKVTEVWICRAQCMTESEGRLVGHGPVSGHDSESSADAFDKMVGNCQEKTDSDSVILARSSASNFSESESSSFSNSYSSGRGGIIFLLGFGSQSSSGASSSSSWNTSKSAGNSVDYAKEGLDCKLTKAPVERAPRTIGGKKVQE